jgi:hypothetical protein
LGNPSIQTIDTAAGKSLLENKLGVLWPFPASESLTQKIDVDAITQKQSPRNSYRLQILKKKKKKKKKKKIFMILHKNMIFSVGYTQYERIH